MNVDDRNTGKERPPYPDDSGHPAEEKIAETELSRISGQRRPAVSVANRQSADDDFDQLARRQWEHHLAGMSPDIARSKGWGGNYWKTWMATFSLVDAVDIVDTANDSCCESEDAPVPNLSPDNVVSVRLSEEHRQLEELRRNNMNERSNCLDSVQERSTGIVPNATDKSPAVEFTPKMCGADERAENGSCWAF